MESVLRNMANRLLLDFCKAQGSDCSGTYCVKDGRGVNGRYAYVLRKDKPTDPRWPDVARVTLHNNQEPTYGWN